MDSDIVHVSSTHDPGMKKAKAGVDWLGLACRIGVNDETSVSRAFSLKVVHSDREENLLQRRRNCTG